MKGHNKKTIYYITKYPFFLDGLQVRDGQMSVKNKSDYIIKTLIECGYKVVVLSNSQYIGNKIYDGGGIKKINKNTALVMFWCFRYSKGIFRYIKNRCCETQIYLYLLFKLSAHDNVMVYHSCDYVLSINLIQKLKHFNLILEIEDIYHKVWKVKSRIANAEKKLLSQPYKSVVVSELMKKILNKPHAIVSYGAYSTYNGDISRNVDNKILIVCTGSFDKNRGTGLLALNTVEMLPDNYVLYMSGVISSDISEYMLNKINEINQMSGYEKCKFLGLLNEKEYEDLLLKANIGLNTQKEGDFSSYIFPSKILKYLSYNLDVVTTPGESIVYSPLKNYLHITESFSPEKIAECIVSIDLGNHKDYRGVLRNMHEKFKKELVSLIDC